MGNHTFARNPYNECTMIPDYSKTYFPPPGSSPRQLDYGSTYFPPPPERQAVHLQHVSAVSSGRNHQASSPSLFPLPPGHSTLNSTQNIVSPRSQLTHHPSHLHDPIHPPQPTHHPQHNASYGHPHTLPPPSDQDHRGTSTNASNPYHVQPQPHLLPPVHAQIIPSPQPSPSLIPAQKTQSYSNDPPVAFRTFFASISLHSSDRLRLLRFPAAIHPLIRATLLSAWPRGIQSESKIYSSHEFQMRGNPWGIFSTEMKALRGAFGENMSDQMIYARRLMCGVLAALHTEGWVLMVATDISKVQWDTDTLVFRHQSPPPAACEWFSVAFSSSSKIRFVDAPRDLCMKVVERLGKRKFELKCKEHSVEGCYEIKLSGMLWGLMSNEMMKTREMLLDMLECFEECGWTVYASIDQKVGSQQEGETDTWHCCKPLNWKSGAPVYHN